MINSRSSSERLFVLDLSGGRIFSLNPDGSDPITLVTGCRLPDGLAVDLAAGYIYDATHSYRLAFLHGLLWNLVNLALVGWLMIWPKWRQRNKARRAEPGARLRQAS